MENHPQTEPGLELELETTIQFFEWLRSRLPKARIIWKEGNHEARLPRYMAKNAPALCGTKHIMLPVLGALEALHRRGVIHRDLKPSNIFLSSYGVKLVDFGLARPTTVKDVDDTTLTQPGVVLGTPRYMAPEQARGAAIDHRADIFAAGAVLFELLSGRPAFQALIKSLSLALLMSYLPALPPSSCSMASEGQLPAVMAV